MANNNIHYSKEFEKLIEDKEKTKYLIEGNRVIGVDFKQWEKIRFFISNAINKDGRILDIGCANGFLLRCLQEWCNYKLEPYGIDINQKIIQQAKELFPSYSDNFVCENFWNLLNGNSKLSKGYLSNRYDFVYFNVGDNLKFEKETEISAIRYMLGMVSNGGRLILGFCNCFGLSNEGREKIKRLEESGFAFSNIQENSTNDIIAWIDNFA